MNLAILGAGESSRIRAEGLKSPKHLIKINNEYLIERIIRIARNNGIEKIFCIINSHESELRDYLSSADFRVPFRLLIKDTESSMHSLFNLAPYLKDAPFCLATTDSVFPENDFTRFINYATDQKETDGVLAITDFIDDEKPLCVSTDEENTIREFSDTKEGYNWATGGVYYFLPLIFNEMQYALQNRISKLRNYLKLLVDRGYSLKGFPFSKIIDVDHMLDIPKAEDLIKGIF